MANTLVIILAAVLLCAGAAALVLRAFVRAEDGPKQRPAKAFIVAGIAGAAAFGAYLYLGRPDLPGQPYAPRVAALKDRSLESLTSEEVLAILSQRAREEPGAYEPHLYSGQVYLMAGDADRAARAFDAALRREPNLAPALLGLGRALVARNDGLVTSDAEAVLREAAAAAPNDPAPWLYIATGAMQQERNEDARAAWREAYQRMGPEDPRREMAQRMINLESFENIPN